VNIYF